VLVEQLLAEFFEGIVAMCSSELFDVGERLGIDFDGRSASVRLGLCCASRAVGANQVLDKGVADGESFGELAL